MGKDNEDRRESSWLTVRDLANALDVGTDFVRREVLRRCPPDAVRRDGRKIEVYGRTAIECWLKHRLREEVRRELIAAEMETAAMLYLGE